MSLRELANACSTQHHVIRKVVLDSGEVMAHGGHGSPRVDVEGGALSLVEEDLRLCRAHAQRHGSFSGLQRLPAERKPKAKSRMKRLSMLLFLAASFTYPQDVSRPTATETFDFKGRFAWYAQRTYTDPWKHVCLIGEVTADDFVFGDVKRWGSGLSGWGKSLAPVYGQRVIDNTTEFLLGALVGDDARYRPSEKRGIVRRSLHATIDVFTARARSGNTRPAYSRIVAITTGTLIANQWRSKPKTGANLTRALVFGITDKIQDDLLQEFSPDLRRFGHSLWRKVLYTSRRFLRSGPDQP